MHDQEKSERPRKAWLTWLSANKMSACTLIIAFNNIQPDEVVIWETEFPLLPSNFTRARNNRANILLLLRTLSISHRRLDRLLDSFWENRFYFWGHKFGLRLVQLEGGWGRWEPGRPAGTDNFESELHQRAAFPPPQPPPPPPPLLPAAAFLRKAERGPIKHLGRKAPVATLLIEPSKRSLQ